MADAHKTLQTLTEDYQKLQTELQSNVDARQKLESQQQENKSVQMVVDIGLQLDVSDNRQEFVKLDDGANIFKLVGPVLLKQDRSEAVLAVDGRLDYIEKEIRRVEKQIIDIQDQSEQKKTELIRLQTQDG